MIMPPVSPTSAYDSATSGSPVRQITNRSNRDARLEDTKVRPTLIGQSLVMRKLISVIERIAPKDSSVLITGATGTGKELVAWAIHDRSPRCDAPFVDINCSAIPDTLIEAELFGHQRGTFTGAHETRRGLFQEASGGTLFLYKLDACGFPAQPKLLRVLQEHQLQPLPVRQPMPL